MYPDRPDSTKNRQRWNFGTLFPPAAATIGLSSFHAEVLVNGNDDSQLELRVRFLQFTSAEHESIAEAIERYWEPPLVRLGDLLAGTQLSFAFAAGQMEMDGKPRRLQDIHGNIGLRAVRVSPGLFQVALEVANASPSTAKSREDALLYCLTSAHAILQVQKGKFISLLEPDAEFSEAVGRCRNTGVFPVLCGDAPAADTVLVSPIILYDYPQIAPESSGDFFDGTEMDEMLTLRVIDSLGRREEAINSGGQTRPRDPRTSSAIGEEQLRKVHGAIRGSAKGKRRMNDDFDPFAAPQPLESVQVFGVQVRPGSRVRLWPQKRSDILDSALAGQVAVIEAIEQDFENQVHLAVVLEDDPGRDLGPRRQPGHRFFFSPEEVEPLALGESMAADG